MGLGLSEVATGYGDPSDTPEWHREPRIGDGVWREGGTNSPTLSPLSHFPTLNHPLARHYTRPCSSGRSSPSSSGLEFKLMICSNIRVLPPEHTGSPENGGRVYHTRLDLN